MWVNYAISMHLLKRNHWPNLKIPVTEFSYSMGTSRVIEDWKRPIIMPTFEKVKEEIQNYRKGILLLNLGKLMGEISI